MKKLAEVEEAKALMKEAMEWSMFKWLWEKSKVRQIADNANAALDSLNRSTKRKWSEEAKEAYRELTQASHAKSSRKQQGRNGEAKDIDPELARLVQHVKDIDDKARAARMDAEETFDDAERRLSTGLAVEGCKKAIHSWNLHEKAIHEAEALIAMNPEGK
jgi:hypothetical protein